MGLFQEEVLSVYKTEDRRKCVFLGVLINFASPTFLHCKHIAPFKVFQQDEEGMSIHSLQMRCVLVLLLLL